MFEKILLLKIGLFGIQNVPFYLVTKMFPFIILDATLSIFITLEVRTVFLLRFRIQEAMIFS